MNKVNEKRREAHEKWSCLIPRAAAALFLYITSQSLLLLPLLSTVAVNFANLVDSRGELMAC